MRKMTFYWVSVVAFMAGFILVTMLTVKQADAHPRPILVVDGEVERALVETAREFGLDLGKFRAVAKCESGLNPNDDSRSYYGLFQHSKTEWLERVAAFNRSHSYRVEADPHNPFWNARAAGWMIQNAGWGAWPNCGRL